MVGACSYRLTRDQRRWIRTAADMVTDLAVEDLASLVDGAAWDNLWLFEQLPERFSRRFDSTFAKQFVDMLIVVAWKVKDRRWWCPASVAEEIAMWTILEMAVVVADMEGEEFEHGELDDEIFEDLDFRLLYDMKFDGVEDEDPDTEHMGYGHLRFEEWFAPFNDGSRMKPIG